MDFDIERVDVWAAPIADEPGGMAKALASLRDAGADLEFIIARRNHEKPGEGVLFVTPLRGDQEIEAATDLGFNVTNSLHTLRVQGKNEAGLAAIMAGKLAAAAINLRGFSAAVIGSQFIMYIAFDNEKDAEKGEYVLLMK